MKKLLINSLILLSLASSSCGLIMDEVCPKDEPVACPEIFKPVCGSDGIIYENECLAKEAGVSVTFQDVCIPCVVPCPDIWMPVCGSDGVTYSNECEALKYGITVFQEGLCGQDTLIN